MVRRRRITDGLALWTDDPRTMDIDQTWDGPETSGAMMAESFGLENPKPIMCTTPTSGYSMYLVESCGKYYIWEEVMWFVFRITCPTTLEDIRQKMSEAGPGDAGLGGLECEEMRCLGYDEIKYLPSFIPLVTGTLDMSNYSGKRNALWLYPGSNFKTILQLCFRLDSTKELQKLFETDLPGLEITEADVVCKIVTLKGSRFMGSDTDVFFTVRCAIAFNNSRVEMTAGIEIDFRGVTITVNSAPGNFDHTIAWIENVTDLDPAASLASFGPGTIFQELDIQGFGIRLSNDITGKDDPILSSVKLYLEVASYFGKVEGKRPVFKVFTWWRDHEDGDIWHRQVRGELWSSYNNSPGRLLHPDYKPWCDQSPYKELTTVINLEDLPGRSESIEGGYPSQIGKLDVVMTKKLITFESQVNDENNHDRTFRLSATYEWDSGKSDFSLVPFQRSHYWY